MKSDKTVAGRILKGLREFADTLEKGEPISQKFTCRTIKLDLQPAAYTPRKVKARRALLQVSQAVFAQFLGVKASTVRSWEQGAQAPSEMACRFMDEIQRNPAYWRQRLKDSIRVKAG